MKARSTGKPTAHDDGGGFVNAQPALQQKQAASNMPDSRDALLAQLKHQERASSSSQAAQLKARADMMAGENAGASIQRMHDAELLQGRFAVAQRGGDEELLQGKFATVQRVEEEELLQGKFPTVQRVEDEELLQGKFQPVERVDVEELLQGKFAPIQRKDDEELLQGRFDPVERMEEGEPLQRQGDGAASSSAHVPLEHETKPNNTGLPDQLKSGIESLSGMSMDHVKVHYNSDKPAQLQAHAYAQGSEIHVAPGQEQHLPHEAWHVVQQAQGRVKPALQIKGRVGVNDDAGLEREADSMGGRALQTAHDSRNAQPAHLSCDLSSASLGWGVQRKITVGKEQLEYSTPEQAFAALRSTFPDAPEAEFRFHLRQLSEADTGFHNVVTLRHELERRLRSGHMVGTQAHYGTDLGINASKEQAVDNFKAALKAGFRHFDAATFYTMGVGGCSVIALAEAAKECGVGPDELRILFKVLRPDALRDIMDPIEDQVEKANTTLSHYPDTLVLHEVTDLEEGKADLGKLIALVKTNRGKAVGVSNVSMPFLEPLYLHSVNLGVPIKFVQNRFNPYHNDTELRAFCDDHAIQYMGYSVLGSAQQGVCLEDGQGDPRQYLVPLQDPRVLALASKYHLAAGAMLLSWTHQKGVSAVTFTGSGQKRSEDNLAASKTPLSLEVMNALDEIVTRPPESTTRDFGGKQGLSKLYAALLDPTAWFIMDELGKADGGAVILDDLANQIVQRNPEAGPQRDALLNFALNLVRFAADLQSPANKRGEKQWHVVMKEQWAGLASAAGSGADAVRELCTEWACKNAEQGGHAQNAYQDLEQIITGVYVPARPITVTGRNNQPVVVVEDQEAAPVEGDILTLTADNVGMVMKGYVVSSFAEMEVREYSIFYKGKYGLDVAVTAVDAKAGTVTATVIP